jgi:N-acyl-D-aspartate/D-glutamate deacylase
MSTGIIYVPRMFGDTNELIELMKTATKYDGIYTTHMRNEEVGLIDSVIESIRIGVEAGISVEISHLKASGKPAWEKASTALQLIKEYSSQGYDVSADAYPYVASSTSLVTLLPREFREGSIEDILKRL